MEVAENNESYDFENNANEEENVSSDEKPRTLAQ